MPRWVKVVDGTMDAEQLGVEAEGKQFALFRQGGNVFALDDVCSHGYAKLSEGEVWGEEVWCPRHGSCFNIKTGAVRGLPATQNVRSYPVKLEEDGIYVAIE